MKIKRNTTSNNLNYNDINLPQFKNKLNALKNYDKFNLATFVKNYIVQHKKI